MNIKKRRILLAVISIVILTMFSVTNVGAATTGSFTVDNDTSNSNYSNNSNTYVHYSGTWGTYLNNGYNGDSRLRISTTRANYEWVWYGNLRSTKRVKWEISVFLANNSFTDPKALYQVKEDSNLYMSVCSFNINQNLAPSGFSNFSGVSTPGPSNGELHPWFGHVENSGIANVGTGADAFYASFTCE